MLIFRKGTPWYFMLRMSGSAIPKAMIPGVVSALITLLIEATVPHEYMDRLLQHPYPFQPFAYAAAFILVFRTNVAYNRYWECTQAVTLMASKWADALVEALTFDELINTNKRLTGEEGDKWLERRRRFQALMIRRFSLMHALAMQYLRRDDALGNLRKASGRDPAVPLGLGAFGGMEQPTSRSDPRWRELEVLGGCVQSESEQLESSADRVGFVYAQIMHLSNQRRADGGLGADAPVLSRYYQLLSDGMLGFRQARKIEDIPFPFPYTQAVSAYIAVFAMIFPLILSHFANCGADRTCDEPTWWVGPTLSFITVTSYVTLQQVARALEDPFVHPPNDLPANALQVSFNARLLTTWDAIRNRGDAAAAAASTSLPSSPMLPSRFEHGNGGGSSIDLQLGGGSSSAAEEAELWGEYAVLEDDDVRRACTLVLQEWRAYGKNARLRRFDGRGHVSTPKLVRMSRPSAPRGSLSSSSAEFAPPTIARSKTSPNLGSNVNVCTPSMEIEPSQPSPRSRESGIDLLPEPL